MFFLSIWLIYCQSIVLDPRIETVIRLFLLLQRYLNYDLWTIEILFTLKLILFLADSYIATFHIDFLKFLAILQKEAFFLSSLTFNLPGMEAESWTIFSWLWDTIYNYKVWTLNLHQKTCTCVESHSRLGYRIAWP